MDKKQSKQKIEFLVQTFHTEKHEKMNEAETRLRFINPFFEGLGWNILNPKEVRIETPTSRSDSTRPDYRFLIDGKTRFFVEAKKPSVKLTDPMPVFQAKSYGFSSKVPLVILTDFEEFRPFRTLARPKYDRPLGGLIKEYDLTYEDYVEKFDPLYDTFSHDAVFAGELEKRIPTEKKEASATVDKEFLKDLSNWQQELAKNIALRNSKLSVSEINEAVQRILDRIIFLRICEDRQIEENEILLSYVNSGDDIYRRLLKEFTRLRAKYNGLIFNEHRLSELLSIDDKLLKEIIVNLYLPRSPYRFNVIPIEILGTIYEQYLGKVITLTPTHRVKVEVKPEVRKAGGVFYTPQFITSCIVKNTIGKLIAGKTPEQIAKLKFIDITSGSGSFCLEMFDYLIHYHIDYYSANPDKIKTVDGVPDAFQTSDNLWHLSTRKKKEILVNNIYGVDIDPQAVEVTQMSLYLKLLEGESAETFGKQLSFELKETILPNLSSNIKCGNSLVGMDIKGLGNNLTLEEELRLRPFDWETAFPEVMHPSSGSGGGFDAIVGNPPYIRIQTMKEWTPIQVEYLKSHYTSASKGNYDIYVVCVERALSLLNKNGKLGYILPHKFFNAQYGESLRALITNGKYLEKIIHFGDQQIFEGATTYTCLLFLNKAGCEEFTFFKVEDLEAWQQTGKAVEAKIKAETVGSTDWNFAVGEDSQLFKTLSNVRTKLGDIAHIFVGTQTSADEIFVLEDCDLTQRTVTGFSNSLGKKVKVELKATRPFLRGKEIRRYEPLVSDTRLICPYEIKADDFRLLSEKEVMNEFPMTYEYLRANKTALTMREKGRFKGHNWYAFGYPKSMTLFDKHKIVVPDYNNVASFTFDERGHFYKTGYGVILKDTSLSPFYVLSLLNSPLLFWYLTRIGTSLRGGYIRFWTKYIEQLPIRTLDFNNPDEKAMHDKMVQLVERMVDLHKKKQQANADSENELFEHQIKATDKEIDESVYRLYGLSEEERGN